MSTKRKIILLGSILVIVLVGVLINKSKNKIDMSYGKIEYVQSTKDIKEGIPTVIMFRAPYSEECLDMERLFRIIYDEYNGRLNLVYYNMEDYGNDEVMTAIKNYDVKLAPTMVFVDKKGQPKFKEEGVLDKEHIVDILQKVDSDS